VEFLQVEGDMKAINLIGTSSVFLAGALLLSTASGAQQVRQKAQSANPHTSAYDLTREAVLEGTVLKYTENSSTPPIGAHVVVQTSSGPVDVHLGDARFLKFNKFTITEGSSVKIIGQSLQYGQGTMFFAHVVQQGGQALTLRSVDGAPLWLAGARAQRGGIQKSQQVGAL
jgi:DNA/RNA endonuclease YhcR with UshA esterase domain